MNNTVFKLMCALALVFIASLSVASPPWPMQLFKGGGLFGGFFSKRPVGAGARVVSSTGSITLTDEGVGSFVLMTGAGEVGFPDCSSDNIGYFVTVFVRDASEQVELVMSGDTTNDYFRLKAGTALDPNDEADMPTAGNQAATVMCVETNVWYIIASDVALTDGGVAD